VGAGWNPTKATPVFGHCLGFRRSVQPRCKKVNGRNAKGVEINRAENSDLKSNLFRGKMTLQEVDADNYKGR